MTQLTSCNVTGGGVSMFSLSFSIGLVTTSIDLTLGVDEHPTKNKAKIATINAFLIMKIPYN
jgi:hypothetical protein